MRNLVSVQNAIKRNYVTKKAAIPEEPDSDRLFRQIEEFLDELYTRNDKYPIEMLLYSIKRTPGLVPDRGPGARPEQQQRDIEKYYISLLSSKLNSVLEYSEDPESDLSLQGLSHVLRHWPRYGAWKRALFIAISVAGKVKIELPFLNRTIAEFMSDEVLYECAFFALSTRKNYRYSSDRLLLLLNFMTEAGNSAYTVKNGIFTKAYPRFRNLVNRLEQENRDLYGELSFRAAYDESNGKLPIPLIRLFHLEAKGPFGLEDAEDKETFLRENFSLNHDEWNTWAKWIRQLEDEKLFRVLCDVFETKIYPNVEHDSQNKLLFAFAQMDNKELGAAYLHGLNAETSKFRPREGTEEFIRKAVLYAADGSGSAGDLMERFESMPEYERRSILPTMRELYGDHKYREQLKLRIRKLTEGLCKPEVNTLERLKLIDDYTLSMPKRMKGSLTDHRILAMKLKQICGFDQETETEAPPSIPFRILDAVMNLINDTITRDYREEYRGLLYSLLETEVRASVKALMQDLWAEGGKNAK